MTLNFELLTITVRFCTALLKLRVQAVEYNIIIKFVAFDIHKIVIAEDILNIHS